MKTASLTGDIPLGKLYQMLLRLQGHGITIEQLTAIGNERDLALQVSDVLKFKGMFTSPLDQRETFLRLNREVWHDPLITREAIDALGEVPDCPIVSTGCYLFCLTLVFETGSTSETFRRNWQACQHIHDGNILFGRHQATSRLDWLHFGASQVRPSFNARARKGGFRWIVCELGRLYQNHSAVEVRAELLAKKRWGVGSELPLIAALHPKWVQAMDGENVPFLAAPDLVFKSGEGDTVELVPELWVRDGRLVLDGSVPESERGDCGAGSFVYA